MPVVVAYGESAEIIARRYGIPTEAWFVRNGYASAAQIRPGAHIVIPTYNAGLAASSGVRFSAAREEQRRAQAHLHEEHLHFVRGPDPADTRRSRIAESQRSGRMKSWCFAKSMKSWRISRSRICATTPRPIQSCLFIQGRPACGTGHIRSIACLPRPWNPSIDQQAALANAAPEFRWPARGRITEGVSPRLQRRHQYRAARRHCGQGGRSGRRRPMPATKCADMATSFLSAIPMAS